MNSQQWQREFAARIRQPEAVALLPGIDAARMAIYEQLFFDNLSSLLGSAFPVSRRILGQACWQALLRAFLAEHVARSPYFLEVSEEFLAWLQQRSAPSPEVPAFLLELAHYEWVELALSVSPEQLPSSGWSALAWPLAYRWPVAQLGPDYQPEEIPASPTCLLVWRDGEEQVRFMQLAPFAYHLAVALQAGQSVEQALRQLAAEHDLNVDEQLTRQVLMLLGDWRSKQIFLPEPEWMAERLGVCSC